MAQAFEASPATAYTLFDDARARAWARMRHMTHDGKLRILVGPGGASAVPTKYKAAGPEPQSR